MYAVCNPDGAGYAAARDTNQETSLLTESGKVGCTGFAPGQQGNTFCAQFTGEKSVSGIGRGDEKTVAGAG
jgi:hypothetical protein